MNQLVYIENDRVVTDSLTVADVFKKSHDKVLRDIRELECSEEFRLANFGESSYTNQQNKQMPKYLITQDGFSFLVMGYTGKKAAQFKEKYINEFNRMKNQIQNQIDSYMIDDPVTRAQKWIEEQREKQLLQDKIELDKPKVEAHDRFLSAENNQKMNHVAKSLGVGRNTLFKFLRKEKVLMADNTPYQRYIDRGYFIVKERTVKMGEDEVNTVQTYVTAKGVDYIDKLVSEKGEIA
ncbi:phage regulatory protein/antirepressor Ant [Chengkuizengella sp. SCS-71B]|uniref:Rha family transcriptional regulator n=1 Tax=Chengkuizengella sp. SCS-71B TaxID=3115290 RepID=UPI0032C22A7B